MGTVTSRTKEITFGTVQMRSSPVRTIVQFYPSGCRRTLAEPLNCFAREFHAGVDGGTVTL
jgi:hypothetical protein